MRLSRPTPATRNEGLDAWRALLMAAGIFVHGSTLLAPDALLLFVQTVSHLFRVGTFDALAGYLAAVAIGRHGGVPWLMRRLRQVGVPLLFGLVWICPLIPVLIALGPVERPLPLPFEWHHLWFLAGLLAYSPLAVALDAADRRWNLAPRLCERYGHEKPRARLFLLMVVVTAATCQEVGAVVLRVVVSPDWAERLSNAPLIPGYAPLFAFGFVMARCERLRRRLVTDCRFATAVLALLVLGELGWGWSGWASAALGHGLRATFSALVSAAAPLLVFILVLRSSLLIRTLPLAVRRIADASYTIYLVHFPIIVAVNAQLARVAWSPLTKYAIAVTLAAWLGYRFHTHVVKRSTVAAFLFNGRLSNVDPSPRLDRLLQRWEEQAQGAPAMAVAGKRPRLRPSGRLRQ
jgi:glucan biosynthesis protein C